MMHKSEAMKNLSPIIFNIEVTTEAFSVPAVATSFSQMSSILQKPDVYIKQVSKQFYSTYARYILAFF